MKFLICIYNKNLKCITIHKHVKPFGVFNKALILYTNEERYSYFTHGQGTTLTEESMIQNIENVENRKFYIGGASGISIL